MRIAKNNGCKTAKHHDMKEFESSDYSLVCVTSKDNRILLDGIAFAGHNSEERFYLEENVLPVLVPALEQLLKELDDKNKQDDNNLGDKDGGESIGFQIHPLHWVAQFLMRNNPRHNEIIKQHPYFRLMQDHIKTLRPAIEEQRRRRLEEEEAHRRALEEKWRATEKRKLQEEKERKK